MENIDWMKNMEIIKEINEMINELKNRNITIKDDNDMSWFLDKIVYNARMDEVIFECDTEQ